MKYRLLRNPLFVGIVLVPTFLAVVYYALIASDVYISESRFLVRSPQRPTQTGILGQLLQNTGFTSSQDDAYAVRDFILSRDALKELDDKLHLRQAFSEARIDPFNRFPGLSFDHSFEEFYRYYGRHVAVDYDSASSITTLTVRAYSAQDAYHINGMLMDMSEQLVNTLNDRSRHDLVGYAEDEVKLASDKAKEASIALLNYRSSRSVFEPDRQAALQLQGVAKIQDELISTEAELAQLKSLSPDNPQIAALTSRAATLRAAILSEASKVTSARDSLSARAPDFERLALESEFADKQLGVAFSSLESARAEARQKQLYLERLVQPGLPDKAMEPRRLRSMLTVFVIALIAWGVATLLIAAVKEHAE
jgi:capsular polysaccharide transport system permease protein